MPNEANTSSESAFFDKVGTETSGNIRRKGRLADELNLEGQQNASGPVPRWSHNGEMFWPASATCPTLPPGIYRFDQVPNIGACLHKVNLSIDNLIRLPDSATEKVLAEFSTFWGLKDRFVARGFLHKRGILLWGPPGCLGAETIIHYQAFKDGKRTSKKDVPIECLYQLFHGLTGAGKGRDQKLADGAEIRISSVDDEGRIFSNRVLNVVKSGIKPVYRMLSVSGLEIIATKDHKFLSEGKYVALANLAPGQRVSVHLNTLGNPNVDEIDDVHENWTNDELDNLCVYSHADHARLHATGRSSFFYMTSEEIECIELIGEQETYDIQMEAPYNNFIANYFVVHNSGKTASLMLMAQDIIEHHDGIVCQIDHPGLAGVCLAQIRKIEPDRPIIALIEDLDALVERHGENQFLSLLDGESQVDRIVYVACPAPDTLVLKADLIWARADSLQAGDELIAFDEQNTGYGRRYRTAEVRSAPLIEKLRYRVTTEMGTTVVSEGHPFLIKIGNRPHEWRLAEELKPGNKIASIGHPWETDLTWGGGYLAGQFDGEGMLNITFNEETGSHGFRATCGQAKGDVAERMQQVLDDHGYDIKLYDTKIQGICQDGVTPLKPQISISLADGRWGSLKFVGAVRPIRILKHPRLKEAWENSRISITHYPKVLSVESLGLGPVVALDTSTNTFIGDGYLQHNTTNYPERLDKRFVDRPSRFDTIEWIGMPGAGARRAYLENKEPSLRAAELDRWVKSTDGFSVAHLRELVILVKCFDRPLAAAIQRLEAMRLRQPKSNDAPDKPIFGIIGNSRNDDEGWEEAASSELPTG